jgi:hypothetical protein
MSIPIDDIPDDVNDDDVNDAMFSQEASWGQLGGQQGSKKKGYFARYKEYILLCVAVLIAVNIPVSLTRGQLPYQVFRFGDAPITTLIVLILYIIMKQVT